MSDEERKKILDNGVRQIMMVMVNLASYGISPDEISKAIMSMSQSTMSATKQNFQGFGQNETVHA